MKIDYKLLKQKLKDLPGWSAQKLMAPEVGDEYRKLTDDHRSAGVMALLYKERGEDFIVIIERSKSNPNDKHAGQLSFPGGKYEEEDGDMLTCALREVEEEIGVLSHQIEVLGNLSQLFVFASNFLVFPYVGVLETKPNFKIQESEVHSVLTTPISRLLDFSVKQKKDMKLRNRYTLTDVPYYDIEGKTLWGATAMIMSELEIILTSRMI